MELIIVASLHFAVKDDAETVSVPEWLLSTHYILILKFQKCTWFLFGWTSRKKVAWNEVKKKKNSQEQTWRHLPVFVSVCLCWGCLFQLDLHFAIYGMETKLIFASSPGDQAEGHWRKDPFEISLLVQRLGVACQCREHGFGLCSRKILYAMEQHTSKLLKTVCWEPILHINRCHYNEKSVQYSQSVALTHGN